MILTPMRLGLCLPIQRGDTAHDFLEAHFVRFVSVAILHARNPLALQAQKGLTMTAAAPFCSKDGGSKRRQAFGLVDA